MGSGISDIIGEICPRYKDGPASSHTLGYDSAVETLEPVYFFILDLMNDFGLKPEKIIDNFSSSPGSGHFAELGQRATIMQGQASKIMGDINTVLRSVLNLIYDLKEFRMRLQSYDDLKDPKTKDGAVLSLKQLWMDKVDIQKGNSSIKAMALGQAGFVTLIDAFLAAKDEKAVNNLDLNERVKRILIPRIQEFNTWINQSERELRKRYELEKTYLKSQVNSLKLYTRWAKPYLKAAYSLENKDMGKEPALVKTFNTIILELVLIGKRELKVVDSALDGLLPKEFAKEKFSKGFRKYYSCLFLEFTFRGIPQRVSQQAHFTFGGKVDVTFKSYALNEDELKRFNKKMDESDLDDALKLINGATDESLNQLQEEINFFLEEKDKDKEKENEKNKDTSNPFMALFGMYDKSKSKEPPKKEKDKKGEDLSKPMKKENWVEKSQLRTLADDVAKETAMKLFEIYKKSHQMASFT